MNPTGYEYTILSDRPPLNFLNALNAELQRRWPAVLSEIGPDYESFEFGDWLQGVNEAPERVDLYFASDSAAFSHIENNGIVSNADSYQFFLLCITAKSEICYRAKILGYLDEDNTNFGEFHAEIVAGPMWIYELVMPEATTGSPDDLLSTLRRLLRNR